VRGQQAFVNTFAEMVYQRKIDRSVLARLVRKVFHSRAQRRLPSGIPRADQFRLHISSAETLIATRHETMTMIDGIDDGTFQWARFFYNANLSRYLQAQPSLAQSREWGHLFNEPTMQDIISFACRDLVDTLGMARIINAHRESLWNPDAWRRHKLRFNDHGEVVTPGGVIYPR
jgi:hypothetical protein